MTTRTDVDGLNVTAVAVAAMGVIGSGVGWVINRRPEQADYASRLLDSTVPAYETLSKRLGTVEGMVAQAEQRAERAEREVEECERRHDRLEQAHNQLRSDYDRLAGYLARLDLKPPD